MKNQYIIGLVVVIIVAILGFVFVSQNKSSEPTTEMQPTVSSQPQASDSATMEDDKMASPSGMMDNVHEFMVEASNFKFLPTEIKVKKGDKVKITFKNTGGTHDFVIDEFNVESKRINGGSQDIIEFTADKAGTFEFYCNVGNHRSMGMKGNLIVE